LPLELPGNEDRREPFCNYVHTAHFDVTLRVDDETVAVEFTELREPRDLTGEYMQ
jgi:hypothetical protein